jgi:hypothetical protein
MGGEGGPILGNRGSWVVKTPKCWSNLTIFARREGSNKASAFLVTSSFMRKGSKSYVPILGLHHQVTRKGFGPIFKGRLGGKDHESYLVGEMHPHPFQPRRI